MSEDFIEVQSFEEHSEGEHGGISKQGVAIRIRDDDSAEVRLQGA